MVDSLKVVTEFVAYWLNQKLEPMKDLPSEISSVMNLILPLNKQLPIGKLFISKFFTENNNGRLNFKSEEKKNELKKSLKGKVSFLMSMDSEVKKVFAGKTIGNLSHLNVVTDKMSDFQTEAYIQAYNKDMEGLKGIYTNSRQAILFVFPDGTYGEEGFKKYINEETKSSFTIKEDGVKKKIYNYIPSDELKKAILADTEEEMLAKLHKYSSKFAVTIKNIINCYNSKKSCFVYSEFVNGSGCILFASILSLFGFTRGLPSSSGIARRYILATRKTSSVNQVKELIKRFNEPSNMHGEIFNVIIGSAIISEGFTLKNIQEETILTPWFNYSETDQVIARGWRLGSHNDLINSNITPTVKIFQRVSIPRGLKKSNLVSIDLVMYEMSELKDINIKLIERIMRESAFDCSLNYLRNKRGEEYNGKRECDYLDCNYKCDGGVSLNEKNIDLDYSTYQLYYIAPSVKKIIKQVKELFRNTFRLDINNIIKHFPDNKLFEIITALQIIINKSIQIINKYGLPSYLKEEENIFFLVDSLTILGKITSEYYTKYPSIKLNNTFEKISNDIFYDFLPTIVNKACNTDSVEKLRELIFMTPIKVQETMLESSILSNVSEMTINTTTRDNMLEIYKDSFSEIDGVWVSWLDKLRCLDTKDMVWKDCESEYKQIVDNLHKQITTDLESNEIGYYGLYNMKTDAFCIKDVSDKNINDDNRTVKTGKVCSTWNKTKLFNIIINIAKIPIPPEDYLYKTDEQLWDVINNKKFLENFRSEPKDTISLDYLERIVYWGSKKGKDFCKALRKWFNDKNMLIENSACGAGPMSKSAKPKSAKPKSTKPKSTKPK